MSTVDPPGQGGIVSESQTARGSLLNGVSSILSTGLGFLLVIVITNTFGADDTGVFFGVLALFSIVATAAKLGTETALVLLVARFRAEGSHRSIRLALVGSLVPVAAVSGLTAAALYMLAGPLSNLFSDDRAQSFADVLRSLAPFLPAWAIGLVLLGATRGAGTMVPTAVGLQIVQPIAQIVFVFIAATQSWGLPALAIAWGAPLVLTALIGFIGLWPFLQVSATEPGVHRSDIWRELWVFAGPRGLAGTLQLSLDRVGILLIGALATSTAAGQWAAISRLIGVAQRSFHAIGQALNPRLSSLAHRQDWQSVSRVFDQITLATVAALTPALLALGLFPKSALNLFGGSEFEAASRPLTMAAFATFAAVAFAHVDNVLLMAGRSWTVLINAAAALVTTIALDLVLVPPFGLEGAAIAMAGGVLVYRGLAALQVSRGYQIRPMSQPVIMVLAVAFGVAGGLMLIGRVLAGDRLVVAILSGITSVVVYAGVLFNQRKALGLNLSFDAD